MNSRIGVLLSPPMANRFPRFPPQTHRARINVGAGRISQPALVQRAIYRARTAVITAIRTVALPTRDSKNSFVARLALDQSLSGYRSGRQLDSIEHRYAACLEIQCTVVTCRRGGNFYFYAVAALNFIAKKFDFIAVAKDY